MLRRLLSDSRLVTLVGPGGVGKTRLAAHVTGAIQHHFADGAALVELGAVTDPALVPRTVARVLGVAGPRISVADGVLAFLRGRHLLLVLDKLRACRGCVRDARAVTAARGRLGPHRRDKPRAAAGGRRGRVSGAATAAYRGRAGRVARGGDAVRPPRRGRGAGVRRDAGR
ncbi:hypothetical protein JYA91_29260 (plasmid) [Rhodococcus sp. PSBB049]|nr:hypothetical protein JYA91_29260 [Rhodococcus sp. PSBB049]